MSMKLLDYFKDVKDPRVERTKLHKLGKRSGGLG